MALVSQVLTNKTAPIKAKLSIFRPFFEISSVAIFFNKISYKFQKGETFQKFLFLLNFHQKRYSLQNESFIDLVIFHTFGHIWCQSVISGSLTLRNTKYVE